MTSPGGTWPRIKQSWTTLSCASVCPIRSTQIINVSPSFLVFQSLGNTRSGSSGFFRWVLPTLKLRTEWTWWSLHYSEWPVSKFPVGRRFLIFSFRTRKYPSKKEWVLHCKGSFLSLWRTRQSPPKRDRVL